MDADEMFAELVAGSGDRLLRLAYQLTHDRATAQDVVQEALTSMYRSWRRRPVEVEHLPAYARRAVVNEFLRRRRLRSAAEVVVDVVPEPAADVCRDIGGAVADRDEMWRALGALSASQRAVLVLRYYEDLPDARIAELLDVAPATVRSLAARGLTALRRTSFEVPRRTT